MGLNGAPFPGRLRSDELMLGHHQVAHLLEGLKVSGGLTNPERQFGVVVAGPPGAYELGGSPPGIRPVQLDQGYAREGRRGRLIAPPWILRDAAGQGVAEKAQRSPYARQASAGLRVSVDRQQVQLVERRLDLRGAGALQVVIGDQVGRGQSGPLRPGTTGGGRGACQATGAR